MPWTARDLETVDTAQSGRGGPVQAGTWNPSPDLSQENPHVATGAKAGLGRPGSQVLVCPVSVSSVFLEVVSQS